MAHRQLTDSSGRLWDVWDVRPEFAERRRTRGDPPDDVGERRRRDEYRLPIREELSAGWLAFDSKSERRRLIPIPDLWETLADAALQALLEAAPIYSVRPTLRLIE